MKKEEYESKAKEDCLKLKQVQEELNLIQKKHKSLMDEVKTNVTDQGSNYKQ